jgi:hypothetical protein
MARTLTGRPSPPSSRREAHAAPVRLDGEALIHARVTAFSGVLFAGLFTAALVLVRQAPGLGVPDSVYTSFYREGPGNVLVTAGLYVVPFAGIAFLWHMSAARTLVESLPGPRSAMPSWLQLASGVVFVAMLFAGMATVGAVALLTVFSEAPLPPPDVARALAATGYGMVFVFGVRASGMFMITTTTLARRRGLLPRAVTLPSYLAAALLLFSTTFHPSILLVFPGWVLLVSGTVLLKARRLRDQPPTATVPTQEKHA